MNGRPAVVVLGATAEDPPPGIGAAAAVAELRFAADGGSLPGALRGASALLAWGAERRWLEDAWEAAEDLRWIQAASDGVDRLLFPELAERGVVVTNARGIFDDAIGEWVVGVMLAMSTGLATSIADQQRRRWDHDRRTRRLAGTRLLSVGPGPIGRAVAVRAHALGMEIAAVGRAARQDPLFGRIGGPEDFARMLGAADVILDVLPLTPETRHRFDAAAFAAMRPTARFVNVGRGGTVDETALIDALRRGAIGGAALDVFEREPLPEDSPLWTMPNVIVSPHLCGDVEGWEADVVRLFVDNLGRFVRGEPLRNRVDLTLGFGVG
ncbi:MAG TPA: D-2-hydroxyacid dehydrogenase [Actinomycetota bacterium]|nr:D-2-hydroxyacid dehydrogenase [Actinomycetota bacterium]